MVSAIVLMRCEKAMVSKTGQMLAEIDGISEVYSVAGRVDLVAVVRVKDNEALAEVVTNRMQTVPGILATETLISFQVFSKHDLEAMFSIGLES